jgi:hypothetical protein
VRDDGNAPAAFQHGVLDSFERLQAVKASRGDADVVFVDALLLHVLVEELAAVVEQDRHAFHDHVGLFRSLFHERHRDIDADERHDEDERL